MKEFEAMQIIWDRQTDEKMYAIDESALHAQIKAKSQSIERKVDLFEWIMIGVNLIVAIVLVIDAVRDMNLWFEYLPAAAYLGFAVYSVYRRLARRRDEIHFDETMLGELDKAIWRINYLITQTRTIIFWYLVPLMLVFALTAVLNARLWWAIGLPLALLPLTYLASRWEIRRFYLPKKKAMESLREKLLAA